MIKESNFRFVGLSKEQSTELTTIVKETIATGFVPVKKFTVVDLWNIRRGGKSAVYSKRLTAIL